MAAAAMRSHFLTAHPAAVAGTAAGLDLVQRRFDRGVLNAGWISGIADHMRTDLGEAALRVAVTRVPVVHPGSICAMYGVGRFSSMTSVRFVVAPGRWVALALVCVGMLLAASSSAGAAPRPGPPHVGHVFVINLENKGFASTFGPGSPAPYLSNT